MFPEFKFSKKITKNIFLGNHKVVISSCEKKLGMLKTKLLGMVFGLFVLGNSVYAQMSRAEFDQLYVELEGTYQIQMVNTRQQPAINSDSYLRIREERKQSEGSVIVVNEKVQIYILSQDEVNRGVRFEEEERVAYITK